MSHTSSQALNLFVRESDIAASSLERPFFNRLFLAFHTRVTQLFLSLFVCFFPSSGKGWRQRTLLVLHTNRSSKLRPFPSGCSRPWKSQWFRGRCSSWRHRCSLASDSASRKQRDLGSRASRDFRWRNTLWGCLRAFRRREGETGCVDHDCTGAHSERRNAEYNFKPKLILFSIQLTVIIPALKSKENGWQRVQGSCSCSLQRNKCNLKSTQSIPVWHLLYLVFKSFFLLPSYSFNIIFSVLWCSISFFFSTDFPHSASSYSWKPAQSDSECKYSELALLVLPWISMVVALTSFKTSKVRLASTNHF